MIAVAHGPLEKSGWLLLCFTLKSAGSWKCNTFSGIKLQNETFLLGKGSRKANEAKEALGRFPLQGCFFKGFF